MIITIGGPPGSGKTTVAKLLAKKLGFEFISVGEKFRELAKKRMVSLKEFGKLAEEDYSIDKELDKSILDSRHDNTVYEGRLVGLLFAKNNIKALKVWVDAPLAIRAERIAQREKISIEQAKLDIISREKSEQARYTAIYDFDPTDLNVYDIIVESGDKTPEQVVDFIIKKLNSKA